MYLGCLDFKEMEKGLEDDSAEEGAGGEAEGMMGTCSVVTVQSEK